MGASNVLSHSSDVQNGTILPLAAASGHGIATFFGVIIAGLVPLLADLLLWFEEERFVAATALALMTLFAVWAIRAVFTGRGLLVSGLKMEPIERSRAAPMHDPTLSKSRLPLGSAASFAAPSCWWITCSSGPLAYCGLGRLGKVAAKLCRLNLAITDDMTDAPFSKLLTIFFPVSCLLPVSGNGHETKVDHPADWLCRTRRIHEYPGSCCPRSASRRWP
jgi:hypothetical protein